MVWVARDEPHRLVARDRLFPRGMLFLQLGIDFFLAPNVTLVSVLAITVRLRSACRRGQNRQDRVSTSRSASRAPLGAPPSSSQMGSYGTPPTPVRHPIDRVRSCRICGRVGRCRDTPGLRVKRYLFDNQPGPELRLFRRAEGRYRAPGSGLSWDHRQWL
jgi:hypothetical protein